MIAISGPMFGSDNKPTSPRCLLYTKNAAAAIATIPPARPSSPSIKLIDCVIPNNQKTVNNGIQSLGKTNTSKNGTRKKNMVTPNVTSASAATTTPVTFIGADTSRMSSTIPKTKTTTAAMSTPINSELS